MGGPGLLTSTSSAAGPSAYTAAAAATLADAATNMNHDAKRLCEKPRLARGPKPHPNPRRRVSQVQSLISMGRHPADRRMLFLPLSSAGDRIRGACQQLLVDLDAQARPRGRDQIAILPGERFPQVLGL